MKIKLAFGILIIGFISISSFAHPVPAWKNQSADTAVARYNNAVLEFEDLTPPFENLLERFFRRIVYDLGADVEPLILATSTLANEINYSIKYYRQAVLDPNRISKVSSREEIDWLESRTTDVLDARTEIIAKIDRLDRYVTGLENLEIGRAMIKRWRKNALAARAKRLNELENELRYTKQARLKIDKFAD